MFKGLLDDFFGSLSDQGDENNTSFFEDVIVPNPDDSSKTDFFGIPYDDTVMKNIKPTYDD
jgi:hypothetical protein